MRKELTRSQGGNRMAAALLILIYMGLGRAILRDIDHKIESRGGRWWILRGKEEFDQILLIAIWPAPVMVYGFFRFFDWLFEDELED